jgi:hypothetical protein
LACAFVCSALHGQVSVAFKGCASDGQTGPVEAPKGKSISPPNNAETASQLAFYKSAFGVGVLAPRSWYCFGTYGSGGDALYISPQPIDTENLLSTNWIGLTGPAIEISQRYGDISGRFSVAEIIARVFPAYKAFVTGVMAEDLPSPSFTFAPYPRDTLTYKSKTVVEYKTLANADGLGTHSQLKKNGHQIMGVAILVGQTPNALLLSVRLPPDLTGLTSAIIRQVERDAARIPRN